MNKKLVKLLRVACSVFGAVVFAQATFVAVAKAEEYRIDRSYSSGSTWESPRISNAPIDSVQVTVRRNDPRNKDTYLTLEFDDGLQFESGQRMQVDHEYVHTVSWNGRAVRANGRRLLLHVNGSVFIERVVITQQEVRYRDENDEHHPRHHRDDRCGSRDRDEEYDDEDRYDRRDDYRRDRYEDERDWRRRDENRW